MKREFAFLLILVLLSACFMFVAAPDAPCGDDVKISEAVSTDVEVIVLKEPGSLMLCDEQSKATAVSRSDAEQTMNYSYCSNESWTFNGTRTYRYDVSVATTDCYGRDSGHTSI